MVVLDSFFVTLEEPFLVVVVVVVVVVTTVVTIVVESSKFLSSFDKAGLNGHQFAFFYLEVDLLQDGVVFFILERNVIQ